MRIIAQEFRASSIQVGIGQWFAFGIGICNAIGIESLRVTVDFTSITEAKGSADIFDNRAVTIKFLNPETRIALSDSDSDADSDLISPR